MERRILSQITKNGDQSECDNYIGIILLSVPGKVLDRIILERLKAAVDRKLRDHQVGLQHERSCIDQIVTENHRAITRMEFFLVYNLY